MPNAIHNTEALRVGGTWPGISSGQDLEGVRGELARHPGFKCTKAQAEEREASSQVSICHGRMKLGLPV